MLYFHCRFLLIVYTLLIESAFSQTVLISSFRTATSFLHKSGDPIYISNQTDIWRICPPALDASHCSPNLQSSPNCIVLDPGCRCYNWYLEETPYIIGQGKCVFVKIPQPELIANITWSLDFTFPVAPSGYHLFAKVLFDRLISKAVTFDTYASTLLPLLCNEARQQSFGPIVDNCQYRHVLNFSYIPAVKIQIKNVTSIGRVILQAICIPLVIILAISTFRRKQKKKID